MQDTLTPQHTVDSVASRLHRITEFQTGLLLHLIPAKISWLYRHALNLVIVIDLLRRTLSTGTHRLSYTCCESTSAECLPAVYASHVPAGYHICTHRVSRLHVLRERPGSAFML